MVKTQKVPTTNRAKTGASKSRKTVPARIGFQAMPPVSIDAPSDVMNALFAAERLTGLPASHIMLCCVERQLGYFKRNPEPKRPLVDIACFNGETGFEALSRDQRGNYFIQLEFGPTTAICYADAMRWFISRQNFAAGKFSKEDDEARWFLKGVNPVTHRVEHSIRRDER